MARSRRDSRQFEDGQDDLQLTRRDLLRKGAAGGAAVVGAGALGGFGSLLEAAQAAAPPKRGGTLRIGIAGGSAGDVFDPYASNGPSESIRNRTFYESMIRLNGRFRKEQNLVESFEPNRNGTVWTIRVNPDVEFHNGKTLDADDLLFSFRRMRTIPGPSQGHTRLVDLKRTRKLDKNTLRVVLTAPQSFFDDAVSLSGFVVPVGFNPRKPVSTGPWKLKSFIAGRQTVLERFPNYWGQDAWADELVFVEIPDDGARVNALLAGQVHAINLVPHAQMSAIKNSGNRLLISPTGAWNPITMRVDTPPFNDVRVRQAIRLMMDRKQAVDIALAGQGVVASDVFSPYDADFDRSLVRRQDIDRAKSLLRQAGHSDLNVELVVAPVAAGIVQASQILSQNARAAGARITVRQVDPGTYFSRYGKWPFSMDFWIALPYMSTCSVVDGPNSGALNTTHFKDAKFNALYNQVSRTFDPRKRRELKREMQRIQFNKGGNLIWSFHNSIDAYSPKIAGFDRIDRTGFGFGQCKLNLVHFV